MSLFARRVISTTQRAVAQSQRRAFHTPFAVLSRAASPETVSSSASFSQQQEQLSSAYTKQASPVEESINASSNATSYAAGAADSLPRIHIVSGDAHPTYSRGPAPEVLESVPIGAYAVSEPF